MNVIQNNKNNAFSDFKIDFEALRSYASSEEGYRALLTEAQNSLARWQRELETQTTVPEQPDDFLHPMIGALSYLLPEGQIKKIKLLMLDIQTHQWGKKRNQMLDLLTRLQKDLI